MPKLKWEENEQLRFLIVAGSYNVAGTLLYWGMLAIGWPYLIANLVSSALSVNLAYLLNTRLVFRQPYTRSNFIRFWSVYASSLAISTVIMVVLVQFLHINAYLANPAVILLGLVYNYGLTKFWAMKGKDK